MKLHKNKKGFELQNLYGFVLLLVMLAMIIGIGVLVIDKFSTAVFIDRDVVNESITTPAYNSKVSFSQHNLTKFTSFKNTSGIAYPGGNYTVDLAAGTLNNTLNINQTCYEGQTCYVSFTWRDWGSKSVATLNASRAAITPIATTWLPLIVTIVVLAIILTIVIRAFGQRRE